MDKKEKLPMVIDFDKKRYTAFQTKVDEFKEAIQQFLNDLEEIIDLKITPAIYENVLTGDGQLIAQIIVDKIRKAKGIPSKLLREQMANDMWNEYSIRYKDLKNRLSRIALGTSVNDIRKCLLWTGTTVSISDTAIKEAKRRYERRIETKRGLKVYETQQKMVDAINAFIDLDETGTLRAIDVRKYYSLDVSINREAVLFHVDYDRFGLK